MAVSDKDFEIEMVKPDERLIALVEIVLKQNEKILEQNAIIVKSACSPVLQVRQEFFLEKKELRYGSFEILYDKHHCQYCFVRQGYVFIEFGIEAAHQIGFDRCVRELHSKFERVSKKRLVKSIRKWVL